MRLETTEYTFTDIFVFLLQMLKTVQHKIRESSKESESRNEVFEIIFRADTRRII